MATPSFEAGKSKSPRVKTVKIPLDVLRELDKIPDRTVSTDFAPWEDEVIKKYYGIKPRKAIGDILKKTRWQMEERIKFLGLVKT